MSGSGPQLLWAPFPPPFRPTEELVSSQGLGTGWPGAGKKGEGAAWHRRADWVCAACVFQSLTLESGAQSKTALLLESQKTDPEGRILVGAQSLGKSVR